MLGLLAEIKNHPKGLLTLFLTELWERFSYYGMRAILVLYLVSEHNNSNPGLGWSNSDAIKLYGWYTALVYLACIPGGIIGDKFLNNRDAVTIGGAFLCIGHLTLAIQNQSFFFYWTNINYYGSWLTQAKYFNSCRTSLQRKR